MDYKNGKIYKITDIAYTKMYIGSTCQSLSKRLSKHKSDYKLWKDGKKNKVTSFDLFDEFGIENCKIELIENYECNCKDELQKKEGEHIKNNDCVNKYIPCRTQKEYREANKDKIKDNKKKYYIDNKDKILEYKKEYKQLNKEKISEYKKEYQQANKEKISEYKKKYREANKDKILEYNKGYSAKKKLAMAEL
jgi:hypothetical protein